MPPPPAVSLPARDPATRRVGVTVTFLRMDHAPPPGLRLPADAEVQRVRRCTVPFYRYLYDTVGADYLWWLRRTLPDATLAALLADPDVSVHVLYRAGAPAGFFELDRRARPVVNLGYFGLLPHAIGQHLGAAFLSAAIQAAWLPGTHALTVNTCTADHPRALPGYERAGFRVMRRVDESWDIPLRLGLRLPTHLIV